MYYSIALPIKIFPIIARIFLLFAIFFLCQGAKSQEIIPKKLGEAFTITQIFVDIGANDAQVAKDLALSVAKKSAYKRLLARMVLDYNPEDMPNPTELNEIIDKLTINQEQSLMKNDAQKTDNNQAYKHRYHAQIVVQFNPIKTQSLWVQKKYQFAMVESSPILIVPYYDNGTPVVWDNVNQLHDAIRLQLPRDGLMRFVLPELDDRRKDFLTTDMVKRIDERGLANIMNLYATPQILIIGAVGGAVAGQDFFQFEAQLLGKDWLTKRYEFRMQKAVGQDISELLNPATAKILADLESDWKKYAMVSANNSIKYKYLLQFQFADYNEWLSVQDRLTRMKNFATIKIMKFEPYRVDAEIIYFGDKNNLKNDLQLAGFVLSTDSNDKLGIKIKK